MTEGMIGDDMTRGDIGENAILAALAVLVGQIARIDEESRLADAGALQPGDQLHRPLVGREKGAAASRYVVKGESDALLRRGRRRGDQSQDEERDQPAHPLTPSSG